MRAIAIERYGEPSEARLFDLPRPEPGQGEVLVRLRAAALNHADLWTISGALGFPIEFPYILGVDGAGEIAGRGDGVPSALRDGAGVMIDPTISCGECELCRAGDQSACVAFRLLGEHLPGTFAEYIAVPAANVFPIPSHLTFEQAAALGTTFITAYRMLFTRGALKPGEWVLITGVGGGLALALLQLARPVAGRIIVTSSSQEKLERALALGADEGVNYREEDVGKAVRRLTGKRGVDLVVDSAGGPSVDAGMRSLVRGGRMVIAGATAGAQAEIDVRRLFWNQVSIIGSTMGSRRDVADMLRFVAGARVEPDIARIYRLEDAPEALRYLQGQERIGKVVLQIA